MVKFTPSFIDESAKGSHYVKLEERPIRSRKRIAREFFQEVSRSSGRKEDERRIKSLIGMIIARQKR